MSRKTAALLGPAFMAALLAAFFLFFIRAGLTDLGRPSLGSSFDFQSYFLPRFVYGSKALLHGRVPLWNPFEFGGLPFLATGQPSVFYPPKVLLYGLLPCEAGHWAFLILHYVLAAATMFYFLRRERVHAVSALVGVTVWVFSVPILSSNYHPTRLGNLAWLPLVFALTERVGRGNRRAFVVLSLVVALQLTAGYPEFPMDTALLVGVHAIACWASGSWSEPPWRALLRIGGAFVLGALSAAAQLVPLAELARLSSRELLMQPGKFSFPAAIGPAPLSLTVPGLAGLSVLGLVARRSRPAVAGFLFCMIVANGGWRILRLVPGFSVIRFPLVWVYLATFYSAWLGALGTDEIVRPEGSIRRARRFTGGLAVAALLSVIFYVVGFRSIGHTGDELATSISMGVGNGLAAAFGISGIVALAVLGALSRRRTIHDALWMCAISGIVIAQLFAFPFGAKPSPFHPPAPSGQVAGFEHDYGQLTGRALAPNDILYGYEVADENPSPLGVELSFLPSRQRGIVARLGFSSLFGRVDWNAVGRARGYLDAMDVELLVAPPELERALAARGLVVAARAEDASYLRNPTRMGHAWVDYAVRRVRSEKQALDYFVGGRFDPRREVLLEGPTRHSFPPPSSATAPATAPIRERRTSTTQVTWDVVLPEPGIFVASESAYPGWVATVDGQPATWLRADYVLRGVELEAGRHQVSFDYRPASFRVGVLLSALGLLSIAALVILWRRNVSTGRLSSA